MSKYKIIYKVKNECCCLKEDFRLQVRFHRIKPQILIISRSLRTSKVVVSPLPWLVEEREPVHLGQMGPVGTMIYTWKCDHNLGACLDITHWVSESTFTSAANFYVDCINRLCKLILRGKKSKSISNWIILLNMHSGGGQYKYYGSIRMEESTIWPLSPPLH